MDQEEIMNTYLEQANKYKKRQSILTMAGSFADAVGSVIDYSALKGELSNYRIQANQVELQAKQRANQLREQFLGAVGQYTTNASRRGISIASGSVRQNIESSAMSLGKDIQKETENARMKANVLRGQAKVLKHKGKSQMYANISKSAIQMGIGYNDYLSSK
jgi:hypothetical protein